MSPYRVSEPPAPAPDRHARRLRAQAYAHRLAQIAAAAAGFGAGAALLAIIAYGVARSNDPPACVESVTLLGGGSSQAACETRGRLEVTPVDGRQLARCVCTR